MADEPYSKFLKDELILRDYLAAERTALANERTFLAYIRTALTLSVVGITFIKFFGSLMVFILGWIFVPIGIITFIIGLIRFRKMRALIRTVIERDLNILKNE
jgi:putative membrane protein